ncbi:hypothetical protein ACFYXS_39545 [Streptomyces sp. NPDC002574]|uniref:hypothetical protein n=1 Tax=Streptomyces sp. NPDC002574 TaxID=3364652 RepID=UPI0036AE85C7
MSRSTRRLRRTPHALASAAVKDLVQVGGLVGQGVDAFVEVVMGIRGGITCGHTSSFTISTGSSPRSIARRMGTGADTPYCHGSSVRIRGRLV